MKALLRNESTLDLEQLLWKKQARGPLERTCASQVFSFLRLGDFEVSCLAAAKNTNLDGISVQERRSIAMAFTLWVAFGARRRRGNAIASQRSSPRWAIESTTRGCTSC